MKKKQLNPLTLNRETLKTLRADQLSHRIEGGGVVHSERADNYAVGLCASGPMSGFC